MKAKYQATHYPSELTDKQWSKIEKYFPIGNKSKYHKRSLVEAVLYIVLWYHSGKRFLGCSLD